MKRHVLLAAVLTIGLALIFASIAHAQTPTTISGLPAAGNLTGAEKVPMDQNSVTSRSTLALISQFAIEQALSQQNTWNYPQIFTDDVYVDNTVASGARNLVFRTSGVNRFIWGLDSATESGSNNGSNLQGCRYSDAGSFLDCPLVINRHTGNVGFSAGLTGNLTGNVSGSAGSLAITTTISITGDVAYTSGPFNGTANVTGTGTIQAGAVTGSKLAAGAALANIGAGGITSTYLGGGAALANIGSGGITSTYYGAASIAGSDIASSTIGNGNFAVAPAQTIKCNPLSSTAAIQDCTATQVNAFLAAVGGPAASLSPGASIAMTGDVAWNSGVFTGSSNLTAAGTIQAGAVTASKMASGAALANIGAGGLTSTYLGSGAALANIGGGGIPAGYLAASAVSLANMANMSADTILCNSGGSAAAPADCAPSTVAAQLVGTTSGTLAAGNDSRFGGPTQNSQSAGYTMVAADAGGQLYHPPSDPTGRTWTIPANAAVAFPIGTKIDLVNDTGAGAISITINSDTLVFFPTGSTGSRVLAASGEATITKVSATRWIITGVGVSWFPVCPMWRRRRRRPANDNRVEWAGAA
jgi:hypothetical protein